MLLNFISVLSQRNAGRFGAMTLVAAFALTFATANPAHAQQQSAVISTEFTALSLDGSISGIKFDNGSKSEDLFVPSASRSVQYSYRGPANIVFYVPDQDIDGNPIKRTVGSVNLSELAGKNPLLIFSKIEDVQQQYRIAAINDSSDNFPGNTWRVFNLTHSALALKVGTENPKAISAGSMQTFSFNTPRGPHRIQIAIAGNDGWQLASNSIWSSNPQVRSLIFVFPSNNSRSVRVRQFDQNMN